MEAWTLYLSTYFLSFGKPPLFCIGGLHLPEVL